VHVDDFGTGSSSLACLHQFPVDTLKIDRSFVANSGEANGLTALLLAIVQMARTLGIRVVAEGIETPEQLLLLQSIECQFGQGFLLGRPMPVEAIVSYRRETPPALALPDGAEPEGCAA
jgi:EAL domain-containing protein (putative c-di-GMP-specific phosphodiesterase class I)